MHMFGLVLAIIFSLSCSPEGDLTRTLHAPHQRYLDRQNPLAAKKAESQQLLTPGLPSSCQTVSDSPLCLNCQDETNQVYRCYDFKGPWTPGTDCHHNAEFVKCLVKKPPFALYLEHRNSDEKLFQENTRIWIEAVNRIWEEKLSEDEKRESQRNFEALRVMAESVTAKISLESEDSQRFSEILGLKTPEQQKIAERFLEKIQADRLAGQLKLTEVLKDFAELIKQTHGPSPLLEKFGTMSLEGLEVE